MIKKIITSHREAAALRDRDLAQSTLFFFYGSLMQHYANFNRRLKRSATRIDRAYTHGHLYAFPSGLPGFVHPDEPCSGLVAGQVMRFSNPGRILKMLDRFESYYPSKPGKSIYRRALKEVLVFDEGTGGFVKEKAWIYHWGVHRLQGTRIECGHWEAYRSKPPRYRSSPRDGYARLRYEPGQNKPVAHDLRGAPLVLPECRHQCESRGDCRYLQEP